MHAPTGDEHAGNTDLAADAGGALFLWVGIGAHREIAALAVVDALAGIEAIDANPGSGRIAFGRPDDRSAGDVKGGFGGPIGMERHPALGAEPGRVDASDRHAGRRCYAEDCSGGRDVILAEAGPGDD